MLEETAERVVSRLSEVSIDSGDAKATITIGDYSALALDTVTVTIDATAHVLTEGTDWNRGASNTAAATSLAAAIDALEEVSASSSAAVVTITAPANITSLAVSDAVNMTLVDSSLTTIYDPEKNWETTPGWTNAIVEVEVDDIHYYRTCSSNTANILTIATLPVGHPVTPGAHYNIRISARIAKISGETVDIQTPTEIKTGALLAVTAGSGGTIITSGAIKAATIKSATLSGDVFVGGHVTMPYSGYGLLLKKDEAWNFDIDNFGKIRVCANVSGEFISFGGVA